MDQETTPFWMKDESLRSYPALKEDMQCDVCVVGAGIAGLATAYLLCREGKKVIVLDNGLVAGGQTMRSTGHLTTALDDKYGKLENLFGEEGAKLARASHQAAIDFVRDLVQRHKIDCDFEMLNAYLFVPPHDTSGILQKEFLAAQKAGLDVEMVERCPFLSFHTGEALCFTGQAQFHPLKFITKLCDLIEANGGKIYCNTHVTQIKESYRIETKQQRHVDATHVVVATNSPIHNRFFPHLKQAAYRTYAMAGKVPRGYVAMGLYYDTLNPYHYIRIAPDSATQDILIVGGEDYRTGEEDNVAKRFSDLEAWAVERFPKLENISHRWSGQIIEPIDSLGFNGRTKDELYIITGDSGNGLTNGILGGILINDLIHQRKSRWEKLYNPNRVTFKSVPEFLKETLNTTLQYSDWITPGEHVELEPHCGKVVREGLTKCAIYKDEKGKIHKMSAVCPHLKAIVHWNAVEHCWECPAHGSRFNALGEVIEGPANSSLEKLVTKNMQYEMR